MKFLADLSTKLMTANDVVVQFDLNFIWNSEIIKEWYTQERKLISQETPKL